MNLENLKYPFTIYYDMGEKKPGCVLLQAAFGATVDHYFIHGLDWLLSPSDNGKLYMINNAQEAGTLIKFSKKKPKQ